VLERRLRDLKTPEDYKRVYGDQWREAMKQTERLAKIGVYADAAILGGSFVRVGTRGLTHVRERHFPSGARSAGKSLFYAGEDVTKLAAAGERVVAVRQAGGNFVRIVDAGRMIGIDRVTGQATSIYTIITDAAGNLITMFPGRP